MFVMINLLLVKCNCLLLNLFILFYISDIFEVWESCQVSDLIWRSIFVPLILNILCLSFTWKSWAFCNLSMNVEYECIEVLFIFTKV